MSAAALFSIEAEVKAYIAECELTEAEQKTWRYHEKRMRFMAQRGWKTARFSRTALRLARRLREEFAVVAFPWIIAGLSHACHQAAGGWAWSMWCVRGCSEIGSSDRARDCRRRVVDLVAHPCPYNRADLEVTITI